jgi:hypothetical protein
MKGRVGADLEMRWNVRTFIIKSTAMRYLMLSLVFLGTAAMGRDLFVVVHTTDALVEQFVCENGGVGPNNALPIRSVVRNPGGVNWHAVGGRAPYTVIRHNTDARGTVCVTLIDADGQVATSCGVVQSRVQVVQVDCERYDATPVPAQIKRPTTTTKERAQYHREQRMLAVERSRSNQRTLPVRPTGTRGDGIERVVRERTPQRTSQGEGGTVVRSLPRAPERRF